ncbi:MAG: endonuclease III domain-containing protein [Halanaerobiales bacterium]
MYPCSFYGKKSLKEALEEIYNKLYNEFGPQGWWPAKTSFEVIIGAILTQSVNWINVEKAIYNLKEYNHRLTGKAELSMQLLDGLEQEKLAELIRPSGYYNMKARKLKAFINFLLQEYEGNLNKMFEEKLEILRPKLLNIYGIGPETADSILLYAGQYPIFVIDAYTKRLFSRCALAPEQVDYHQLQQLVMENFSPQVARYNEYHALIVAIGKNFCKKNNPNCRKCPLSG